MVNDFAVFRRERSKTLRVALVSFSIPYGGTEDYVVVLRAAFELAGCHATSFVITRGRSFTLPSPESIDLCIFIGGPPLDVGVDNIAYWRLVGAKAKVHLAIIDPLPYDFKRKSVLEFFDALSTARNLSASAIDRFDVTLLRSYFKGNIFHFPSPGYVFRLHASRSCNAPGGAAERLIFWGSVDAELLKFDVVNVLQSAERVLGGSIALTDLDEFVMAAPSVLRSLASRGLLSSSEWLRNESWRDIAVLDSYAKRRRRVLLLDSVRDLPVDFWGKNWSRYLRAGDEARTYCPVPDENRVFPMLFQRYRGVLNIEPSFSDGANERSTTAAYLGLPLANSQTEMLSGYRGVFSYQYSAASIRRAVNDALNWEASDGWRPELSPEHVTLKFLECLDF